MGVALPVLSRLKIVRSCVCVCFHCVFFSSVVLVFVQPFLSAFCMFRWFPFRVSFCIFLRLLAGSPIGWLALPGCQFSDNWLDETDNDFLDVRFYFGP